MCDEIFKILLETEYVLLRRTKRTARGTRRFHPYPPLSFLPLIICEKRVLRVVVVVVVDMGRKCRKMTRVIFWCLLGFDTLTITHHTEFFFQTRRKNQLHFCPPLLLLLLRCAKDDDFDERDNFGEIDDEKEEEKDKKI